MQHDQSVVYNEILRLSRELDDLAENLLREGEATQNKEAQRIIDRIVDKIDKALWDENAGLIKALKLIKDNPFG